MTPKLLFIVTAEGKTKTVKLPIIVALGLSIAAILVVLYLTFTDETLVYLKSTSIRYEFFIAAIIVSFIYWVVWGWRLQVLSNSIRDDFHIGLLESTKIVIANLFLANITPSMAGGEPVRIYLLNKDGLSTGEATAAVIAERLLDAVFLVLCFPFAFLVFRNRINNEAFQLALTIAVGIFFIAILVFALILKNPGKTKKFLFWINDKLSRFSKKKKDKKNVFNKISKEVDLFSGSIRIYLTKSKKAFVFSFFLTALFWAVGWIIPILILLGLGLPPYIIESSAAQILVIIVVMMPTLPGSVGITEGGLAALYSIFIPEILIGVFVLLFRLSTYYFGLILGALFQYRIFKSVASFSVDKIKKEKKL